MLGDIILPALADYAKLSHNHVIIFKLQNNEQNVSKYQGVIILHVATWKLMKESSNDFLLWCVASCQYVVCHFS